MVLDREATNQLPSFADDAPESLTVQENTPAGKNIGDPFTATDDDDTALTYVLGGTDAASFAIDASTGQLQTKAALDHETKPTYSVTVSVHDGKDPWGNADVTADDNIDVAINVTNMDAPDPPAQPTVTARRGAAAALSVSWTAVAETETAPVDGYDVQYREKDADPAVDWSAGDVTVTGETATITGSGLDYGKTYEVQVRSKNSEGESGWSPTGEGTIPARLDVTFSPASRTVNEGSSASYTVTVSPTADRALSIPVSVTRGTAESGDYSVSGTPLSFTSGDTSKGFTISTTDDSDRSDETLSIRFGQLPAAVGTGSPSTATLTINDTTPAPSNNGGNNPSPLSVSFQQASYTVTEGSSRTITVNVSPAADRALSIRISASSSNAESGDYSVNGTPLVFESGDTSKSFTISTTNDSDRNDETVTLGFTQLPTAVSTATPSTAQLTIDDTTPAPSNNGGSSSSKSGSSGGGGGYSNYRRSSSPVYVAPPSNRAPAFAEGDSTHRSIVKNSAASITIGSPVSASDPDNDPLTYHIGGMDGASFSINSNSGQLLTSSVLDFEVQNSYSIYILVSDGEGGSDRINVSIFVIDVDESPPPVPVPQPTETPTPEPTEAPTPTPEPTEEPTPTATATLEPTPTVAPTPTTIPTAVPTPTLAPTPTAEPTPTAVPPPELPEEGHQQRAAPPEIVDLGNATQPGVGQTTVAIIPEDIRKFRIWPIILIVLGTILELVSVGMFIKQQEADKRKIWAGY